MAIGEQRILLETINGSIANKLEPMTDNRGNHVFFFDVRNSPVVDRGSLFRFPPSTDDLLRVLRTLNHVRLGVITDAPPGGRYRRLPPTKFLDVIPNPIVFRNLKIERFPITECRRTTKGNYACTTTTRF